MRTQTGTPYYASPEVWKDRPYSFQCDVWSLGCVIYELCALNPPFKARDMKGLYSKVVTGKYPQISSRFGDLRSIISSMLRVDPRKRVTVSKLLALPELED